MLLYRWGRCSGQRRSMLSASQWLRALRSSVAAVGSQSGTNDERQRLDPGTYCSTDRPLERGTADERNRPASADHKKRGHRKSASFRTPKAAVACGETGDRQGHRPQRASRRNVQLADGRPRGRCLPLLWRPDDHGQAVLQQALRGGLRQNEQGEKQSYGGLMAVSKEAQAG